MEIIPANTDSINILIVDDEESIRESLRTYFELFSLTIFECVNFQEAVDILKKETVHIMLVDIYLAGSSGKDLLIHVKKHYPTIPVVMMTGMPDVQDVRDVMKAGAYAYVLKPFELDKLEKIICALAGKKRLLIKKDQKR